MPDQLGPGNRKLAAHIHFADAFAAGKIGSAQLGQVSPSFRRVDSVQRNALRGKINDIILHYCERKDGVVPRFQKSVIGIGKHDPLPLR